MEKVSRKGCPRKHPVSSKAVRVRILPPASLISVSRVHEYSLVKHEAVEKRGEMKWIMKLRKG
jgi:hypothetical protein